MFAVFVGALYLFEAVMDAVEFVNCHYSGGKSGGLKHDFCYAKHDMHAAVASDSFHSCVYFGYGFGMFLLAKNMRKGLLYRYRIKKNAQRGNFG